MLYKITMIKERYVSYEVALLLKDKGFDERCYMSYWLRIKNSPELIHLEQSSNQFSDCLYAPTQQMACDWLEETFNISIEVWVGIIGYYMFISYALKDPNIAANDVEHKGDMPHGDNSDGSWSSKELAYNEAIKYVLTNLV